MLYKKLLFWTLSIICPLAVCSAVGADDSLDRARAMATSCSSCHSAEHSAENKTGNAAISSFSSLTAVEITSALLEYRSGERQGTLMNRLARGYSEAELIAIAKVLGTK